MHDGGAGGANAGATRRMRPSLADRSADHLTPFHLPGR